jgi:hypothetical protein
VTALRGDTGRTTLDLDSPRWASLRACGGNPRLVPELIRALASAPRRRDWVEVLEQVSHQFSVYPVAYAAIPHLVELALADGTWCAPGLGFLAKMSSVARPSRWREPVPEDLREPFETVMRELAALALRAVCDVRYEAQDFLEVLNAAAVLNGRFNAVPLTWGHAGDDSIEPECPSCGACLVGEFEETTLRLWTMDQHARPTSKKFDVSPRSAPETSWDPSRPPGDDFEWLIALCRRADQPKALQSVCALYGNAVCPACQIEFPGPRGLAQSERHHHEM